MDNNNLPVAREGLPFIFLFAFVTLIFAVLGWGCLATIGLLLSLFTVYFFRDPDRYDPKEEGAVIAPADGKIVFCGEVAEDRYFKGPAFKVSIFMSVFNVHVNRAPCSGKVIDTYYNKGSFLNASLDKASLANEQAGVWMKTESGHDLLFVQIAGLIARRIVTYAKPGDSLTRNSRYGLIRFGSRVDVYFPTGSDIQVNLGDRTVAGESILGYLK
jgi:phosphatidylserine decarboxylase